MNHRSPLVLIGLLLASVTILSGCGDKALPTQPSGATPTPVVVPTPALGPLSGEWSGTMSGCGAIQASVHQVGASLSFAFAAPCRSGATLFFNGTTSGTELTGRLSTQGSVFCPSASGSSSGTATTLGIHVETAAIPPGPVTILGQCPGLAANTIDLTR